jgi:hypothetical protein
MDLKELIKRSHEISTEKGFWRDFDEIIQKTNDLQKHFTDEEVETIKTTFYIQKLMLVCSELGEATEAMRNDKYFHGDEEFIKEMLKIKENQLNPSQYLGSYQTHFKDTFEDEIADSIIRLLDLCEKMNIDIEKFIELKLLYNKERPEKHGKKF